MKISQGLLREIIRKELKLRDRLREQVDIAGPEHVSGAKEDILEAITKLSGDINTRLDALESAVGDLSDKIKAPDEAP
jgi:hypothetical protein